jgi:hypothetical protein
MTTAEAFSDLRPLLFAIAYRMLGSVGEAEDIVQEAFLRYHKATDGGKAEPESPKVPRCAFSGKARPRRMWSTAAAALALD